MDVIINDEHLVNIADAIREKNGSEDTYTPGAMADAIRDIPQEGGGEEVNGIEFDITEVDGGTDALGNPLLKAKNEVGQQVKTKIFYDVYGEKCSKIEVLDLGYADIFYDENGNLKALSTRVNDGVDAESMTINFYDFDELGLGEPPVSYPDFTLSGSDLRQATANKIIGQEYTIPDGATTMICDIYSNKFNNTTTACVVYPAIFGGYTLDDEVFNGVEMYEAFSGRLPTGTRTDFRFDLTEYIKGTTFDISALGTGTMTGKFRLGMMNDASGSSFTATTFGFEIRITNIRFE